MRNLCNAGVIFLPEIFSGEGRSLNFVNVKGQFSKQWNLTTSFLKFTLKLYCMNIVSPNFQNSIHIFVRLSSRKINSFDAFVSAPKRGTQRCFTQTLEEAHSRGWTTNTINLILTINTEDFRVCKIKQNLYFAVTHQYFILNMKSNDMAESKFSCFNPFFIWLQILSSLEI